LFNTEHTAVTPPEVYDKSDQAATSQPQLSSGVLPLTLRVNSVISSHSHNFTYKKQMLTASFQELDQLRWYGMWAMDWITKVQFLEGSRDSSPQHPGPTRTSIQWIPRALPQEVKQLDCEADYYTPPNANVKNAWSYHSICNTASWCGA
jgi:hypothetical protein